VLSRLCELEAEIRKSLTLPHEVAHARLAWWQEECERLAAGAPRHPLTQALVAAQLPTPLAKNCAGLVDTAVWDLAQATFETQRDVTAYCERWAAAVVEPAARQAAPQAASWRTLGAVLREIELLAFVHREAQLGRLRLPLDELARAHLAPEELSAATCPAAAMGVLCARHEALRHALEAAVPEVVPGGEQPAVRGLLVWVQLAWRLSRQAQRALPVWLAPQSAGGWAYGWAAWRAARAAQRGAYRLQ